LSVIFQRGTTAYTCMHSNVNIQVYIQTEGNNE